MVSLIYEPINYNVLLYMNTSLYIVETSLGLFFCEDCLSRLIKIQMTFLWELIRQHNIRLTSDGSIKITFVFLLYSNLPPFDAWSTTRLVPERIENDIKWVTPCCPLFLLVHRLTPSCSVVLFIVQKMSIKQHWSRRWFPQLRRPVAGSCWCMPFKLTIRWTLTQNEWN